MALYGMPPDPPRKGTPEAIILERLEGYRALREQAANSAPASRAENPESNTEAKPQPSAQAPKLNPSPNCTPNENPKEKQPMPATVVTRAKAALRARKTSVKTRTIAVDAPDPERHSRKCKICNHPDRAAIEELFINWHSPQSIHREFAIRHPFDWSAVYRHARATGLYARRAKNLRAVLDHLLANVSSVPPTAHGVIAALRAYTCLTDENRWVEPERRVHIVNEVYRHDGPAPASGPTPSATTLPAISVEPVTSTGHARNQPTMPMSSTAPHSAAQPKPSTCVGSSPVTRHSPLPSNRQPSELESPATNT